MEEKSIKDWNGPSLSGFDCGEEALNVYLSRYALQNEGNGYGRTFLLVEGEEILGYYTLSSASICFEHIPPAIRKGLPRYPAPAIRIARLAVSKSRQGQGVGLTLIKRALTGIVQASVNAGVAFILVDAKEGAKGFYEKLGFIKLLGTDGSYVLLVATVLKAIVG